MKVRRTIVNYNQPNQADRLEPKGKGLGVGICFDDQQALPINPEESITLKILIDGSQERSNPHYGSQRNLTKL